MTLTVYFAALAPLGLVWMWLLRGYPKLLVSRHKDHWVSRNERPISPPASATDIARPIRGTR